MCIGMPMQVVQKKGIYALCRPYASHAIDESDAEMKWINLQLVDDVPIGGWVLTFLDSAREIVSEKVAAQTHQALTAVELVMQGNHQGNHILEQLFADIVDKPPQLPAHLVGERKQEK